MFIEKSIVMMIHVLGNAATPPRMIERKIACLTSAIWLHMYTFGTTSPPAENRNKVWYYLDGLA